MLSCFTGAGGLDLGLEAAGFETVGCLEIDAAARDAIRLNRAHWPLLDPSDVVAAGRSLTPGAIGLTGGELDLLAGGPPCQPFSVAAQWSPTARSGMKDPRGRTIFGMLDLIDRFQPRALLIENVAGFVQGHGNAAAVLEAGLQRVNRRHGTSYSLRWFLVDAADYGAAQHRRRVLATALRDGREVACPPTPTHAEKPLRAWDALNGLDVVDPPQAVGKWAELLPCIPEGENYQYLTARGGGAELFGYRTRYWSFLLKLARDRPAWTLPAVPGPSTGPFHWDNRPLAIEERLALQGFSREWVLKGRPRDLVRLAGNATPPPLAEAAGRQIAVMLSPRHLRRPGESSLALPRARSVPGATPAALLPKKFAALVGAKEAHPGVGAGPGRRSVSATTG
ncbi:MAG TPA: DNA cytosine methyltransferase [Mycobacteriales bacterium]